MSYRGDQDSPPLAQQQQQQMDMMNQFPLQKKILPPSDYNSPYYIPFALAGENPKPIETLVNRFTIWKMILKHVIFYFKEISIVKQQSYLINKAMLDNLDLLKRQSSGKMKLGLNKSSNKLKQSLSSSELLADATNNASQHNLGNNDVLNKCIQTSFRPATDNSVLSITSTLHSWHSQLGEKELITYNQLTLKLIPRLENLKESLNETIKQISSLKTSSDFKLNDLTYEIAKTGGILADYISSIELLTKGETTTSLGTKVQFTKLPPKMDPYLLKLRLDLQLKNQLYTEAHLKESYYDIQYKAVQLDNILFTETKKCVSQFVTLVNNEADSTKENLVNKFMNGFFEKESSYDWDYFINNDNSKNLLKIYAQDSLDRKNKQIRKKSDVIYPYQKDKVSSFFLYGYLEKKSKYLKNYTKAYYVLTFNFLHEFKSEDRKKDITPISSLSLDDIKVSIDKDDARKFILRISSPSTSSSDSQKSKYTFRCPTPEICKKWYDHLTDLSSFSSVLERNNPENGLVAQLNSQKSTYPASTYSASTSNLTYNTGLSNYIPQINQLAQSNLPSLPLPHQNHHHHISVSSLPDVSEISSSETEQPSATPKKNPIMKSMSPSNADYTSSSSTLEKPQYQLSNHSSSSLHLPTFHSVRNALHSPPQEVNYTKSHKKTPSSSSLSSFAQYNNAFKSNNSTPSDHSGTPGSLTSPQEDLQSGDYFNYVAPRPVLRSKGSSGSVSSNEESPKIRGVASPPIMRSKSPQPGLSGTNSNIAGPSKTSNISTTTNNKMSTQGLARSRERFQAQFNKVPSNTSMGMGATNGFKPNFGQSGTGSGSTGFLLKLPDQSSSSGGLLSPRMQSGLPQTPGFLPTTSISESLAAGNSMVDDGPGYFDQRPQVNRVDSSSSIPAIETIRFTDDEEINNDGASATTAVPEIRMYHHD